MPAVVDHAARRRQVTSVAAELLARGGLEALTVRRIAEATGFSTTIVSHYFTDKRELLRMTYRAAAGRALQRFDAARDAADPLRAVLEAVLPLDAGRRRDWRVWCAFWGLAIADASLAREQRKQTTFATGLIAEQLTGPCARRQRVARRLLAVAMGVATQAAFDPAAWPPQLQRAAIRAALRSGRAKQR